MDAFAATATFRAEASQFSGLSYRLQSNVIDILEKFKKAIENDLTVLKSKASMHEKLAEALYNETIKDTAMKVNVAGVAPDAQVTINIDSKTATEITRARVVMLGEEIAFLLERMQKAQAVTEELVSAVGESLIKA